MPITAADFNLQGRVDNYRERLTELLIELDRLVKDEMEAANRDKLGGGGLVTYETRPPRWNLAWKAAGRRYEVSLMTFAQGGAWVIHGRMGLDRPFRGQKSARERDIAELRKEIADQMTTDRLA
ncbi:MAG TPA: hypothetical protein VIN39_08740 [Candidatus Dormibacteraeota bacterium]|jgi:hypothetical protein